MSEGGSNQQSGASDLELFSKMLAEFQVRQAANVEKSKSAQAALDSNFKCTFFSPHDTAPHAFFHVFTSELQRWTILLHRIQPSLRSS